jgi:cytochrome c oxidase cbb3-type subunit 3
MGSSARGLSRIGPRFCAPMLVAVMMSVGSHGQELVGQRQAVANPTGRQVFSASCSSCHGLDGRGGERAPDIATKTPVRHLSDASLFRIINEGVSGTGMPAFRSLGKPRIDATVRYLRELQGQGTSTALPGEPAKGEALFFGRTGCSHCHSVLGVGGFIGSDLSAYAATKSADEIYKDITNPTAGKNRASEVVTATMRDGKKLTGLARNEDNFSLQLQTLDGAFYSFAKSDLQEVQRSNQPLMPTDYSSRLNRAELADLVSYLMKVARSSSSSSDSVTGSRRKPVKTVK